MSEKKRRSPRQARAQASVEAILEAGFQILEHEGEGALNTNLIAQRAGVSIGTLYQYFSSKEEILAELGERHARAIRDRIADILIKAPEQSSVRAIIRALMTGGDGSPATRALLSEALIRHKGESVLSTHHLAFLDSISGRAEFRFPLSPEAAFVLTHGAICLLRAAAAEPELALDRDKLEDELVRMMESYLAALSLPASAS